MYKVSTHLRTPRKDVSSLRFRESEKGRKGEILRCDGKNKTMFDGVRLCLRTLSLYVVTEETSVFVFSLEGRKTDE